MKVVRRRGRGALVVCRDEARHRCPVSFYDDDGEHSAQPARIRSCFQTTMAPSQFFVTLQCGTQIYINVETLST